MTRIIPLLVAILVASSLAPQPVMSSDAVIELLRLEVPATQREGDSPAAAHTAARP